MPLLHPSSSSRARLFRSTVTLTSAAAAGLTMFAAACADAPMAPTRAPSSSPSNAAAQGPQTSTTRQATTASTATTTVNALRWTTPTTLATVSRIIGPEGGSLTIAGGLTMRVPKGAVASNVTFSITRLAGTVVAYDFQPHGITFAVPVQLEQSTLGTSIAHVKSMSGIEGAYFSASTALNQTAGTAAVSEFRPTSISGDRAWIRFPVNHFSGYMVSTDRHSDFSDY